MEREVGRMPLASEVRPYNDYVLVERLKVDEFTHGGIVLPETQINRRGLKCRVHAVGPGSRSKEGIRIPITDIKPGDIVCLRQWSGTAIDVKDVRNTLLCNIELLEAIYE